MGFGYSIYFTERAKNRVLRWDPDSQVADVVAGEATEDDQKLNSPYGLAFDEGGDLLIADKLNHRICRLRNGRLEALVLDDVGGSRARLPDTHAGYDSTLRCPTGLFREEGGSLLCSFADDYTIYRIYPDGRLEHLLGILPNRNYLFTGLRETVPPAEVPTTPLQVPTGIVKRKDGTIFFIERMHQVVRSFHITSGLQCVFPYALQSEHSRKGAAPDLTSLNNYHPAFPASLAVDADDVLFLTEALHACVLRIDLSTGQVRKVLEARRPEGCCDLGVAALAFGPDGTAWIMNSVTNSIEAYAPTVQGLWRSLDIRLTQFRGQTLALPGSGSGLIVGA